MYFPCFFYICVDRSKDKEQGKRPTLTFLFSLYSFFVLFLTCVKFYAQKLWS